MRIHRQKKITRSRTTVVIKLTSLESFQISSPSIEFNLGELFKTSPCLMLSELQSSVSKLFTLSHTIALGILSSPCLGFALLAFMCGNAIFRITLFICYYRRFHERLYRGTKQRYVPINALLQREGTFSVYLCLPFLPPHPLPALSRPPSFSHQVQVPGSVLQTGTR